MESPEAQNWIVSICQELREHPELTAPAQNEEPRIMESFQEWRLSQNLTKTTTPIGPALKQFLETNVQFRDDVGFRSDGSVSWIQVSFTAKVPGDAKPEEKRVDFDKWEGIHNLLLPNYSTIYLSLDEPEE